MIRAGLARTQPSYAGLAPPWHPGASYPEIDAFAPPADAPADTPHNGAYAAVRAALRGLGLDAERFGSEAWNPLGQLVAPGRRIVLKPNFIRHWNPEPDEAVESVVTHGTILRAVADYAFLAAGETGSVAIAEAPQMDCDFERIREIAGLDALVEHYAALGRTLEVIDLRREAVRFEDGIIVSRESLPGDPAGYRVVDLGDRSFFHDSGLDPARFRGADYDPGPTSEHHRDGRNEYLLSETVLSADLVVNLPKLKTHKKTGVTLALKNLVGINGDKNWLPHHSVGSVDQGGDEFPDNRWIDRVRSAATEAVKPLLARGRGLSLFRLARRIESGTRGDDFIRAGNWHGNRTTWRMCVDLNRCLYYSDAEGFHPDAEKPVRHVLTVLDGIVAGEGNGPLAPNARPLGVVIAGVDPLAVDLVAVHLMGFDPRKLPKLREPMASETLRITEVRTEEDVVVGEVDASDFAAVDKPIRDVAAGTPFTPHAGWRGHVEKIERAVA